MLQKRFLLLTALFLVILSGALNVFGQSETAPVLEVTNVLPAPGTKDIETDASITVIFNRPVVPLSLSSDTGAALPNPLQFSPAVSGTGEWLNTAIYLFKPAPALSGGTNYTVTIDPSLTAVDGAQLASAYTWSFTTAPPQIIEVVPNADATGIVLDQTIQVRFNQPMNRASVEASFRLRPRGGGDSVTGTFEWADDGAGFRFTPDSRLGLGTQYAIQFTSVNGLPSGVNGGTPLSGITESVFNTVASPMIVNTSPSEGTGDAYPYGGFTIYFASPMDVSTLEDKITIDPQPWREFDTYYSDYDNSYTLSFPTEPSTNYTITMMPGMRDIYGNQIKEGTVVHYRTAPYDPSLSLETQGDFGFYNSANAATRLFLTHRNVSEVDLSLYRLTMDDLINVMLDPNRYYGSIGETVNLTQQKLVKSWQIPNVAPDNAQRYEYLDLGVTESQLCDGAPPSRIHVGDTIQVITQPDPLRVRSAPLTGSIMTNINRGYTAPVIGGPTCAGAYTWWQIQLQDGQQGWVAEGDSVEYYVEVTIPAQTSPVDVTDAEGHPLAPGIYFLDASAPEVNYPRQHMLIVGNADLMMKTSIDAALIWATDVNTGEPIPNAPISIYDESKTVVATGTTDATGTAQISLPRGQQLTRPLIAALTTDSYFGVGATAWTNGIDPYYFNIGTDYVPEQYRAYLYTDRPLYRPGQPVYYRGVIRLKNDVNYSAPGVATLPVRIFDPDFNIVGTSTVTLTPAGTFSGEFDIADDAALGYYSLDVVLPNEDPDQYYGTSGMINFGVAEYRLPEFQVNVTPQSDAVAAGDTINVTVDSRYYFGGVVSGAKVEYNVQAEPYGFSYDGPGNYTFTDYDADGSPSDTFASIGGLVTSGEGTTDAQGQLNISFPADLGDSKQSLNFTIEATVTDESGQAVSGRAQVVVHRGLLYIGVAPKEYVGTAGQENVFNLIAVDWQGQPIPNQSLDLQFVERRWSSVQEQDANGRTTWTWSVEEIPVDTATVTTDGDGRATATFTPPNGGIFKLKAATRDSGGREVISAATTWVSSTDYVAWRVQNSNRIDLIADKTEYNIGDTAEILIASPFQGAAEALVTVERGETLLSERISLTSNSTIYHLPIKPEYAPDIYVGVFIVKGVDENNPVAAFRMGMIGLNVETTRRELTVNIQPDTDQAGPGDTVGYSIHTSDYAGQPVQSEVGVAVTDLASLSIANPNQVDLLTFFFGPQYLGVYTSSPLTINVDQLTQETLDTVKGGGGGFGEGGIFDIREQFVDTAYWNGSVMTDADGNAHVEVTLPDNLTTWRLDARAVTLPGGDMLVGQNTYDLISTKPLLIRPVTPRFFVAGDDVTLGAVVNNNTNQELQVQVALSSRAGVTFTDGSNGEQTVTIPAGGRQRVDFPVHIDAFPGQDGVDLLFTAEDMAGSYNDASIPPLAQDGLIPIVEYAVPETVGTAGVVSEAGTRTEGIALPTDIPVDAGSLNVQIDPSLAATTVDSLDYLENYPYQCIEQTVSRFLPNIITYRALNSAGLADDNLRGALDRNVRFALQRLYAQQKTDGGWGWFVQDPSDTLTTAYALIGLTEARDQGYQVTDTVISAAQNFLRGGLITPSLNSETWRLNRQAFVLYALARSGAPDVSRTANLYELRARLSYYARAFLALTLDMIDPSDSRADTLLSDLANAANLSATGAYWAESERDYWNWNTDTRTTALALEAFLKIQPDSDLIPNIVRYLVTERRADAWETTQETAWAVMSLTDYMVATGDLQPNYGYTVTLNGETLSTGSVTPGDARNNKTLTVTVAQLLRDQVNMLDFSRTDGTGSLYYRAYLKAYLPVPQVQPLENGIVVSRRYVLNGESVTGAQVGDNVQVRLTIIAPTDLHFVVVEDPIPAGSDAVNPNLNTSQQIGTQPEVNLEDPLSQGWGWWYFSSIEFHDDKVTLSASYLPAGTYEFVYTIRAGLSGTYNVIPPQAYEFYFPEINGRGAGSTFTID